MFVFWTNDSVETFKIEVSKRLKICEWWISEGYNLVKGEN